jgi:hypothetical protein
MNYKEVLEQYGRDTEAKRGTDTMKSKTVPIQMRLKPETIKQMDRLAQRIGSDNRTDVVRTSLAVTQMVTNCYDAGGSVIFKSSSGKESNMILLGIK